jgi:hypothetical protein
LDTEKLPNYLFSKSKQIRTESDINSSSKESDFPEMKNGCSLQKFLYLLADLEIDTAKNPVLLHKSNSLKKPEIDLPEMQIRSSLINLLTNDINFQTSLLYVSSDFTSSIENSLKSSNSYTRNIRSMPMKYESLQNLNLNFPLVPDNHNYKIMFETFSVEVILHLFYGVLLEERILLVTDHVHKLSAIIE